MQEHFIFLEGGTVQACRFHMLSFIYWLALS